MPLYDWLPQPPWKGPPLPRFLLKPTRLAELEEVVGTELARVYGCPSLKEAIKIAAEYKASGYPIVKILRITHPYYISMKKDWEVRAAPSSCPYEVRGTSIEDILRDKEVERTEEWETFYHEPFPEGKTSEELREIISRK